MQGQPKVEVAQVDPEKAPTKTSRTNDTAPGRATLASAKAPDANKHATATTADNAVGRATLASAKAPTAQQGNASGTTQTADGRATLASAKAPPARFLQPSDIPCMFSKGVPQLGEVVETELRDFERIMDEEHVQDESLTSAPVCHGEYHGEPHVCCRVGTDVPLSRMYTGASHGHFGCRPCCSMEGP